MILCSYHATCQEKKIKKIKNADDLIAAIRLVAGKRHRIDSLPQSHRSLYFSFLPVSSQAPGAGIALLTSTTIGFYLSSLPKTSFSTIVFSPYVTFDGRIGFTLKSNLWLARNKWEIIGDTRYLYYPQDTWGLGGSFDDENRLLINYKYVRFYETILRRIRPDFLIGLGYHADAHFDIRSLNDSPTLAKFSGYPYGTGSSENSFSSGLSANILYDERKNEFNPLPGFYGNLVFRVNSTNLGGNTNWQSLYLDLRRYISFSGDEHQNMLAFWTFYWTVFKSHAPYLDLPSIGWDPYQQRSGRGILQNRYRGNSLFYLESEYRKDITENGLFGFVLFANLNSVTEPVTYQFEYLHLAAGGGLRMKFNKRSGTNICLDYGVSRGYSAVYLNLGETF
jgi:hypothetical protein